MRKTYDLLVIGGGINGTGIARDAAGRGFSVCLCEQDDLAAHTSSASTKLIHGGLRYLEQYEFTLVGKALAEREVLLRLAPHIIWPLRFVLPHQSHLRPAWMIRAGLLLYDCLAKSRSLPRSRRVSLRNHTVGLPLQEALRTGFVYSDAWVQDARLVVLNAMDAAQRGANILPRTRCISAWRDTSHWFAELETAAGQRRMVQARAMVNATGPWAATFLNQVAAMPRIHALRLVKGSHIVVSKLFDHDHAYIFQQPDRRIVFAIPYETDFTLIGTTDVDYDGDPAAACIDAAEVAYLCDAANRYFQRQISPQHVVWSYSGVRPLLDEAEDNAAEVTRDYQLELLRGGAPLLNVFGGKLTTYRKLAEEAVDTLSQALGERRRAWTAHGAALPGGAQYNLAALREQMRATHPWLPVTMAQRLVRSYGTRVEQVLGHAPHLQALGLHFGADLYQAEVDYLYRHEWARTAEDILWRRGKLGLRIGTNGREQLHAYLQQAHVTMPEDVHR